MSLEDPDWNGRREPQGAVNDRVDDRLRPRIARNDVNRAEAPIVPHRPASRRPGVDERKRGVDDVRNRALQAPVAVDGQCLPRTGPRLVGLVPQHPDQSLREEGYSGVVLKAWGVKVVVMVCSGGSGAPPPPVVPHGGTASRMS